MPYDTTPPGGDSDTAPSYTRTPREKWTMEKAAERLRRFMRDFESRNHLDMGHLQHTWEDMYDAIEDAIAAYNALAPMTDEWIDTMDYRVYPIIIKRAAVWVLRSESYHQIANEISYSDQGFQVTEHGKTGTFAQLASYLESEFDIEARRMKTAANINSSAGWGGVHHPTYSNPYGDLDIS